jgi:hypothetical protein
VNEIQLREGLFELLPPVSDPDWNDVLARAASRPQRSRRLLPLLLVLLAAVLAVGSALALSGRLNGLLRGTPVNDLTPRERFVLSELDMNGKVELIARRGQQGFYVIRRSDGRRCYTIGDVRTNLTPAQRALRFRFGGGGCLDPRVFPSRAMPVLNYSFYSYRPGDRFAKLAGLQGFAADPVDRIGVIGPNKEIVLTVPVRENVFTAGKRGFPGARGIVALDHGGKVLWVQCTAIGGSPAPQFPSGGCGKYKNSPPPKVPSSIPPAQKPAKSSGPVVVQRGSAEGVRVVVRGAEIDADFSGIAPAKRRLLVFKDGRITIGCFKLVTVGASRTASGTYVSIPFTTILHVRPYRSQSAPFDGCTATGRYGHSWNDAHGTHDLIEIPLTARGRRYFAERAVARDIAWLARARVFKVIRYARDTLSTTAVVARLGPHAVPLSDPAGTPPSGKLGVWSGGDRRVVLVERAPTGRRFFLELRRGILYRTNLIGLTQVL